VLYGYELDDIGAFGRGDMRGDLSIMVANVVGVSCNAALLIMKKLYSGIRDFEAG